MSRRDQRNRKELLRGGRTMENSVEREQGGLGRSSMDWRVRVGKATGR